MTDVEGVTQNADKLKELYQSIQQDQMNKVLYILTMVTTIFIPAQFLTGNTLHSTTCSCATTIAVPNQPQPQLSMVASVCCVAGLYGMNFEVMPELTWKYSYLLFWIGCILIMLIVYVIFSRLRLFSV